MLNFGKIQLFELELQKKRCCLKGLLATKRHEDTKKDKIKFITLCLRAFEATIKNAFETASSFYQ